MPQREKEKRRESAGHDEFIAGNEDGTHGR